MEFQDVINSRASVREFTDQKIEKELLLKLIKNGMKAPSAINKRPWVFYVYESKESINLIRNVSPHGKYNAGAIILVAADKNKFILKARDYFLEDCAAATENILLSAVDNGLGACWIGVYPMKDRVESLKEALKLESNIVPFALIYLGYPKGEVKPKNIDEDNKIHFVD